MKTWVLCLNDTFRHLEGLGNRGVAEDDVYYPKLAVRVEGRALRKVGFYDPLKNQTYLNVPAILYFLERGAQPMGTVHDISKKARVFMELCLNQQIKFN
ncbi:hypothetical protein RGQ29_020010 [Quercus rubra]|uniref:30S ribosomal protein S16, chloroplastic n=1 Tax=Quercus rubra TaxID=3512 RepID=A0AAN7FCL5_QUERU|nr:hypothetical protein RGQ29_020010 [Quercus rubra]